MIRFIILSLMLLCLINQSQSQTVIALVFNADFEGHKQALDSVYIKNLTRGNDTMLYGNDTILMLQHGIGIAEIGKSAAQGLILYPCYPNPFDGSATISLWVSDAEVLLLRVFDITGREVTRFQQKISSGHHTFTFSAGSERYYLLSAETSRHRQVQKMIHVGSGKLSATIEYQGINSSSHGFRISSSGFDWAPGDDLLMTGYAAPLPAIRAGAVLIDDPATSKQYTFYLNRGIPCQDEPFVTDIDGNIYPTVQIGRQCWLRRNLTTTRLSTGSQIPLDTSLSSWAGLPAPARTWYHNDSSGLGLIYGSLYNWYSVNSGNLCPAGWHIPDDTEWNALEAYLGGDSLAVASLKETGTIHWAGPNSAATNASGFTALPGGILSSGQGLFLDLNYAANWWSSSLHNPGSAWMRLLDNNSYNLKRSYSEISHGLSVRCLRNDTITYSLPPKALFEADNNLSVYYDTVAFTDLSANNPTGWKWYFGDGDSSSLQNPVHVYTGNGHYTVTLIVDNQYGSDTLIKNDYITITDPPKWYPVFDYDGNGYDTVTIGTQVWLVQNLRTTHYNDGTPISQLAADSSWTTTFTGAWGWYNNDSVAHDSLYGKLYNWFAVNTGNLCPAGWSVPTETDWDSLTNTLGGLSSSGGEMKDTGTTNWNTPNFAATNASGFTGLPGGFRSHNYGFFSSKGNTGNWWSSSEAENTTVWYRSLSYTSAQQQRNGASKRSGFSVRCIADSTSVPLTLPTINSDTVIISSANLALSGGEVTSDGGTAVTARGVCWGTSPNPTVSDYTTNNGTGIGIFTSNVSGLSPIHTYYIRAYATNNLGTVYGNQFMFTTAPLATYPVYDFDGNGYDTVHIGNQIWLKQNLKTTRNSDGSLIPILATSTLWTADTSGAMAWYNNDSAANFSSYGGLYNQYASSNPLVCPVGWHVPSIAEWDELQGQLYGSVNAGGHLKETGITYWQSPNTFATNTSGFSALPGGYRSGFGAAGSFALGTSGYFWSSTPNASGIMSYLRLYHNSGTITSHHWTNKTVGFSIRCISDTNATPWTYPTVITDSVLSKTTNSAEIACEVLSDGGSAVTSRGICWGYNTVPTLLDDITYAGTGAGSYIAQLSGLYHGTTYYVRSFAINEAGVSYGNILSFSTLLNTVYPVYDIDGNGYDTIRYGNQYWLKQNLRTSRYRNGNSIPIVTSTYAWSVLSTPGTTWYGNDSTQYDFEYGRIYNGYSVFVQDPCPTGWRVPTDVEFNGLMQYLGGASVAGDKMKMAGSVHWINNTTTATNSSNFSAYPGGRRALNGQFDGMGSTANFWCANEVSSTHATMRTLTNTSPAVANSSMDKRAGYSIRCIGDFDTLNPTLPVIRLDSLLWLTTTTATFNLEILNEGSSPVLQRGICWSTSPLPGLFDQVVNAGTGGGQVNPVVSGLISGYYYYARAFAANSTGTVYSDQVSFRTNFGDVFPVYDIDNNGYDTVRIGTQLWLKHNLRTSRYNNGTPIPNVTSPTTWAGLTTGARAWYNNDSTTFDGHYGALYNHYAAASGNICPAGWRVPDATEWQILRNYIGGVSVGGGKLKDASPVYWSPPNTGATNSTGFTGLPGGQILTDGSFTGIETSGHFWTRTFLSANGYHAQLRHNFNTINETSINRKHGHSIRCIYVFTFSVPGVITLPPDSVMPFSAVVGGNAISDGKDSITAKGVCWSTSPSPTIADDTTLNGSHTGSFIAHLTDLQPNTQYYARAYAINGIGVGYGSQVTFTTPQKIFPVYDADGNGYDTVHIGSQIWLKSNLRTTTYNDSTPIVYRNISGYRASLTEGNYSHHNLITDPDRFVQLGRHYTWYAVSRGKLCPQGWHVATDEDWQVMIDNLGDPRQIWKVLIDDVSGLWSYNYSGMTNSSGFSAQPAGFFKRNSYTSYNQTPSIYIGGFWWTQTEADTGSAFSWNLGITDGTLDRNLNAKDMALSVRCVCDTTSLPWFFPEVKTDSVSGITETTAMVHAAVIAEGMGPVLERGVCWDLGPAPTYFMGNVAAGSDTGSYSALITGLIPGTRYYLRAYAANSSGTAYGDEIIIHTTPKVTWSVYDIDGNGYDTVHIGPQVWLKQNLKARRLSNGTSIPAVAGDILVGQTTPARTWYEDDSASYAATYGNLYNWYAANTGLLCPTGYRVPSQADWEQLFNTLGGSGVAGAKLKIPGTSAWFWPNYGAGTDYTGFQALPGGLRIGSLGTTGGAFSDIGFRGSWWATTQASTNNAFYLNLWYNGEIAFLQDCPKNRAQAVRCVRNTLLTGTFLPATSVTNVSGVTSSSATVTGSVTYDGGTAITDHGICYSESPNPTLQDSINSNGTGTGAFNITLSGLQPGIKYFARAYVTNSVGTSYSSEVQIQTLPLPPSVVIDIDGNWYDTVHIGNQIWLKQNLMTTRFNNGMEIPLVTNNTSWAALTNEARVLYNNQSGLLEVYGMLYNGFAAQKGNICPVGWHVPSDSEWTILEDYLGGGLIAGGAMKEDGLALWAAPNTNADNSSGFSARPGGVRNPSGTYQHLGAQGSWWSTTEQDSVQMFVRKVYDNNGYLNRLSQHKNSGFYIRCIIDSLTLPWALPIVTSDAVVKVTDSSGIFSGNVITYNGGQVTARGLCWSQSLKPTINDSVLVIGTGTGTFTGTITGLLPGAHYFVRAFATNESGTAYGEEFHFTTLHPAYPVYDIDSNHYMALRIGNQTWLDRNLTTGRLNDGTSIPMVADQTTWSNMTTPARCWYANDSIQHNAAFGQLYNWHTANTGKLCPTGWHVPSLAELQTLIGHIGTSSNAGGLLKDDDTLYWNSPNLGATNNYYFNARGGGIRTPSFTHKKANGYFWTSDEYSSTSGRHYYMSASNSQLLNYFTFKYVGASVRCIKSGNTVALVSIGNVSSRTQNSVDFSGNVAYDGVDSITVKGFCWSTETPFPTILNDTTINGSDTGSFAGTISGLQPGTVYYARAYAINSMGVEYSKSVRFKTTHVNFYPPHDGDNNIYDTVHIGSQIWLKSNLKAASFSDGSQIPLVTNTSTWASLTSPGTCYHNNDTLSNTMYGSLYNWYVVEQGNVCPDGFYVPTFNDYNTLVAYLGGIPVAGGALKEAGTSNWASPNTGATNSSGFTALPGGFRNENGGFYTTPKYLGYWWTSTAYSSTISYIRSASYTTTNFSSSTSNKKFGNYIRCVADLNIIPWELPDSLTLDSVYNISSTGATVEGSVAVAGGTPITSRGVCYSVTPDPTILNDTASDGSGTGTFTSTITGLIPFTTYYVRSYAINEGGVSYSNQMTFRTLHPYNTVKDIDDNLYDKVNIGNQVWLKQNLRVTRDRDGVVVPAVASGIAWSALSTQARSWYNNDSATYHGKTGLLYNWYGATNPKICPPGFRVPNDSDWTVLTNSTGGMTIAGASLKDTGFVYWNSPNTGAVNFSGFTALPGGYRNESYIYSSYGTSGRWWSTTQFNTSSAWYRELNHDSFAINRDYSSKKHGYSIRCVME